MSAGLDEEKLLSTWRQSRELRRWLKDEDTRDAELATEILSRKAGQAAETFNFAWVAVALLLSFAAFGSDRGDGTLTAYGLSAAIVVSLIAVVVLIFKIRYQSGAEKALVRAHRARADQTVRGSLTTPPDTAAGAAPGS